MSTNLKTSRSNRYPGDLFYRVNDGFVKLILINDASCTWGGDGPAKRPGGIGFALNFLWSLSFFQEKESDKFKNERA